MAQSRGKGGKGASGRTTTTQTKRIGNSANELVGYGTRQKKRPATKTTAPKKKTRTIHKEKWNR